MTKEELKQQLLYTIERYCNQSSSESHELAAEYCLEHIEDFSQQVAKEAAADGWVSVDSYLIDNGVNPHEVAIKGKEIAEKILSKQGGNYVNYAALIEDKLYPVIYTVLQSGKKVFEPKWISGKDLTEPQIKYLYDLGYFSKP